MSLVSREAAEEGGTTVLKALSPNKEHQLSLILNDQWLPVVSRCAHSAHSTASQLAEWSIHGRVIEQAEWRRLPPQINYGRLN